MNKKILYKLYDKFIIEIHLWGGVESIKYETYDTITHYNITHYNITKCSLKYRQFVQWRLKSSARCFNFFSYLKKYFVKFKVWPTNGQLLVYKPIWQCFICIFYLIFDIILFLKNIQIFRKIYRFSYRFFTKKSDFLSRYTDFSKYQVVWSD
jgi:hypothetical protein